MAYTNVKVPKGGLTRSLMQVLIEHKDEITAYVQKQEELLRSRVKDKKNPTGVRASVALIAGLPIDFVETVEKYFRNCHAETLLKKMHTDMLKEEEGE